jgi:hypothetical protein
MPLSSPNTLPATGSVRDRQGRALRSPKSFLPRNVKTVSGIVKPRRSASATPSRIVLALKKSSAVARRAQMLIRKRQPFADMSAEACLGVTAAWSGAVGGLLLIMLLVRLFS